MDQLGKPLPLGFVLLMCFRTWANRMLNITTSGRWVTLSLLFITFLPIIISVDNLISAIASLFGAEDGAYDFIPIDNYNFFLFLGLGVLDRLLGLHVQVPAKFFLCGHTTNAIIFQHAFLLSRSHRRILFDRISEVMVERTPMGTLLGYATVTIMTDSGVGLVEESVGVGAGATGNLPGTAASADDSPTAKASKGIFRSIFAFISYQRTTRVLTTTPATASIKSEGGRTSR